MFPKKPSGAAFKKMREKKKAASVKNTAKLTDLFQREEGLFFSHVS